MGLRKTRKLGSGELASSDPEDSQSVFAARVALIEATREPLPEFLQTLFDDVFPEYCSLVAGHPEFRDFMFTWQMFRALPPRSDYKSVTKALIGWAHRFHADEDWILQHAWRAFKAWDRFPESKQSLEWWQGKNFRSVFVSERFQFEFEQWWPQLRTWTWYRAALQTAFDKAVSEFESKTRAAALAQGLIPAPRTHSADNFDWFVLYQFRGLSSSQIAARIAGSKAEKPPDASTILKGVKTAQKLVGWKRLRADSGIRKTR
jgi:hypothetical protein